MAALLRAQNPVPDQYCGGALVTDRFIITAAHCVRGQKETDITVRLGAYEFENEERKMTNDYKVERIFIHPNYNKTSQQNDIAILKLASKVPFNDDIHPICLPSENNKYVGKMATVVGWGATEYGGPSAKRLQEVTLPIWTNQECITAYKDRIKSTNICAADRKGGKDSCQGDSGGPLMFLGSNERYVLVGVVSWGIRCGDRGFPGVYTRITEFMDWIKMTEIVCVMKLIPKLQNNQCLGLICLLFVILTFFKNGTSQSFRLLLVVYFVNKPTKGFTLKISPKRCNNAVGLEGTCMFVWECIKTEGKHLGTCVDGFLFGSCCGHNDTSNDIDVSTPIKPSSLPVTSSTQSSLFLESVSQNSLNVVTTSVTTTKPFISTVNSVGKPTQKPFVISSQSPLKNTTQTVWKPPAKPWPPPIHIPVSTTTTIATTTSTPRPKPGYYPHPSASNVISQSINKKPVSKVQCGVPQLHPQSKVVGGKNAAFGSWPWQVSVRRTSFFGFSSTHRCGGAILNQHWIATAGHCVDDLLLSQIRIRVGEYDFARGILPSVLQEVKVPIVSNDKCKSMFLTAGRHEYIPEIFMCAGYAEGGRDSCQGDSGGPLQVQGDDGKWFLAGIISWGIGCAEPNLPGVCTRISKFKSWIQIVCMFTFDCMRSNGKAIGVCMDRPFVKSCCKLPLLSTTAATTRKSNCGVRPLRPDSRVVGGRNAYFGEWPWQVLIKEATWLGLFVKTKCGGVLIHKKWVLTAAHCQPGFLGSLIAIVGEYDLTGDVENLKPVAKPVDRYQVFYKWSSCRFCPTVNVNKCFWKPDT
ncbi:secreted salivary gland peptide-like protein [Leptotrombidium deliense]|uniref:Secreted salivary gland peptide-like protein n=1 Tax=Leptotrombidium deliense TaxID=299467 RepID=A0A443SP26_9ACAR|nr:secreted salivary gland peptide-like protein [Leptotrombidium deliense]